MSSILETLPARPPYPQSCAASRARVALQLLGAAAALLLGAGCSTVRTTADAARIEQAPTAASTASPAPATATPTAATPASGAISPLGELSLKPALVDETAAIPAPSAPAARVHTDLWERIRAGFAMPELPTPLVEQKERFYLERPEYLQRMFARGNRYLFHIVEEIERRGLPTELALLPFVESAMNPTALSSARAAGLWQFIPSTGRAYNLQQDWWVDNRRDVVESTEAALDYLQKIYALAGNDWFLALASYNWGENAVARAMRRNQARGLPTDYLSLTMPAETRHYVPKLIALKNIVLHAAELDVRLPPLRNEPYFVTIEKTRPIDLALAARFAGMSVDEFVALNPAHNRPVIAASRNSQIKLPADRLDAFLEAVERHGKASRAFATWQPQTLQPGETIESIARRAGITTAALLEANDLRRGQRILAGTRILAPQHGVDDETRLEGFEGPRVYELVERPAAWHRMVRGETLSAVARRYGTTVAKLRSWNRVGAKPPAGTLLKVRPASTQTVLTTENGDRRIVRRDDDEPKIVHAVLRRQGPAAETAPPEDAKRASTSRASTSRASKSRASRSARSGSATVRSAVPNAARTRSAAARPSKSPAKATVTRQAREGAKIAPAPRSRVAKRT
ncbi:MAG: transglycosylase SLT domain-containing protein [Burkholderiaceae bacterium]|nr:transglycosylase SLT domain-containing protein [Burkholderiaceae bacterium]